MRIYLEIVKKSFNEKIVIINVNNNNMNKFFLNIVFSIIAIIFVIILEKKEFNSIQFPISNKSYIFYD
jgi:hypothetical protein